VALIKPYTKKLYLGFSRNLNLPSDHIVNQHRINKRRLPGVWLLDMEIHSKFSGQRVTLKLFTTFSRIFEKKGSRTPFPRYSTRYESTIILVMSSKDPVTIGDEK
jgi:hypothetical protein